MNQVGLWLYAEVCNTLWLRAPAKMDSMGLASDLPRGESESLPEHNPVFPGVLCEPCFLGWASWPHHSFPCGARSDLCSERRRHCTPQLFHLAVDLATTKKRTALHLVSH